MKKVISIIVLFCVLLAGLFLLTGCGEKASDAKGESTPIISNEEKIIATKTEVEEGITMKSKVEATVKDGIVVSTIVNMEFEDEQTATLTYGVLSKTESNVQLNGKTITMETKKPEGDNSIATKQDFINEFTKEGYTIQN